MNEASKATITLYHLLCPETGEIRYVGQSRWPLKRYQWHLLAARRGRKGRVYNWIRALHSRGSGDPVLKVVRVVAKEVADIEEQQEIAKARRAGASLTNVKPGGMTTRGWRHSSSTKQKIRNAHVGRPKSPETRARISAAKIGTKASEERKVEMMLFNLGRRHSEETKRLLSQMRMGNTHAKGHVPSPETREKIAIALGGERGVEAKVSNRQAAEIRRLHNSGVRQVVLMRDFGLGRVDIHRIVRNKTYRVPEAYFDGVVPPEVTIRGGANLSESAREYERRLIDSVRWRVLEALYKTTEPLSAKQVMRIIGEIDWDRVYQALYNLRTSPFGPITERIGSGLWRLTSEGAALVARLKPALAKSA